MVASIYLRQNLQLKRNCAGSLKVNILGHEKRIEKEDLLTMIKTILM